MSRFQQGSEARPVRRCTLCGVTGEQDPDKQFRICTCEKCGGKPTEFCIEHVHAH